MAHKKRINQWLIWALPTFLILCSMPSEAKVFRNSYLRFQLPDKWGCELKATVWTCRYGIPKVCKGPQSKSTRCQQSIRKYKEAIIHLTAKETGPKDSIQAYKKYLKAAKTIVLKKDEKRRIQSKIIHVETPKIAGLTWVDGMHLASELPNYYTRYLATVKGNVAVLVTFSAHKKYYSKYSSSFFETIKSLKVFSTSKPSSQIAKAGRSNFKSGSMGPTSPIVEDNSFADTESAPEIQPSGLSKKKTLMALGLGGGLLILVGLLFWIKKS